MTGSPSCTVPNPVSDSGLMIHKSASGNDIPHPLQDSEFSTVPPPHGYLTAGIVELFKQCINVYSMHPCTQEQRFAVKAGTLET
jgi:hypothetical protein